MIIENDIYQVLRLSPSRLKTAKNVAYWSFDFRNKRRAWAVPSLTRIETAVHEVVQLLRDIADGHFGVEKRSIFWTAPLIEKEVYIEAALIALVVKCLLYYLGQHGNSTGASRKVHEWMLSPKVIEFSVLPKYPLSHRASRITGRLLDTNLKTESNAAREEYGTAPPQSAEPAMAQMSGSKRRQDRTTKSSETSGGQASSATQTSSNVQQQAEATQNLKASRSFNQLLQTPSVNGDAINVLQTPTTRIAYYTPNQVPELRNDFEILIAHKRDYDAQVDVLNRDLKKLRDANEQKDRKIKELENRRLEDQCDIAELGIGLTAAQAVEPGDESDLESKLLQVGILASTVTRLKGNPTFQRKFTCRKRKQDSDGSTIEVRTDP